MTPSLLDLRPLRIVRLTEAASDMSYAETGEGLVRADEDHHAASSTEP